MALPIVFFGKQSSFFFISLEPRPSFLDAPTTFEKKMWASCQSISFYFSAYSLYVAPMALRLHFFGGKQQHFRGCLRCAYCYFFFRPVTSEKNIVCAPVERPGVFVSAHGPGFPNLPIVGPFLSFFKTLSHFFYISPYQIFPTSLQSHLGVQRWIYFYGV